MLVLVSSLVIPYGSIIRYMYNAVRPIDVERLTIDADSLEPFLKMTETSTELIRGRRMLVITFARGEGFAQSPEQWTRMWSNADLLSDKLVIEAIVRGYVHIEQWDDEGQLIRTAPARIADLHHRSTIRHPFLLDRQNRPAKLVIRH